MYSFYRKTTKHFYYCRSNQHQTIIEGYDSQTPIVTEERISDGLPLFGELHSNFSDNDHPLSITENIISDEYERQPSSDDSR